MLIASAEMPHATGDYTLRVFTSRPIMMSVLDDPYKQRCTGELYGTPRVDNKGQLNAEWYSN